MPYAAAIMNPNAQDFGTYMYRSREATDGIMIKWEETRSLAVLLLQLSRLFKDLKIVDLVWA